MPKTLQVRDVPERLHLRLKERAARRGKSLSAYVRDELERLASEPPLEEWIEELHRHPPVRLRSNVADIVRRERDAR